MLASKRIGWKAVGALLLSWNAAIGLLAVQATVPPSAEIIIQRAVERASDNRLNRTGQDYTYTKINVTEQFDAKGNTKQRKERVFQVCFRAGSSCVKLMEVNGHAPAEADLKFHAAAQSSLRQILGQSNSGADDHVDLLTPELTARFDYTLLGICTLNGRTTYQISFSPKSPEPPERRILDRLLNRISGTLWIDAEEYEIARADFSLSSEVDLLGGIIGCLRKLAYSMTRVRLADGTWLHSISSGDFEGRKLLEPMRFKMKSESMNFQLLAANK